MTANRGQQIGVPFRLFGNPTRTNILLALAVLTESYPRELARIFDAPVSAVQAAIERLELERVVATRLIGRGRRVTLNPAFYGARELRELLVKLADGQPGFAARMDQVARRRPRRRTKPQ